MSEQTFVALVFWVVIAIVVLRIWRRFRPARVRTPDVVAKCVIVTGLEPSTVARLLMQHALNMDDPEVVAAVLAKNGKLSARTAHAMFMGVVAVAMSERNQRASHPLADELPSTTRPASDPIPAVPVDPSRSVASRKPH